jgi:hypothetical protein
MPRVSAMILSPATYIRVSIKYLLLCTPPTYRTLFEESRVSRHVFATCKLNQEAATHAYQRKDGKIGCSSKYLPHRYHTVDTTVQLSYNRTLDEKREKASKNATCSRTHHALCHGHGHLGHRYLSTIDLRSHIQQNPYPIPSIPIHTNHDNDS